MHSVARVATGAQLFTSVVGAVLAVTVGISTYDLPQKSLSCCLASATCAVAYYHYCQILEVRKAPKSTKQNDEVASIRFSDWVVTLPGLVIELHLLNLLVEFLLLNL